MNDPMSIDTLGTMPNQPRYSDQEALKLYEAAWEAGEMSTATFLRLSRPYRQPEAEQAT